MYFEEYGKGNDRTIVMLHGANFVHCFSKQYCLSDRFHIIVPHIMGYGKAADRVFCAEEACAELAEFIAGLGKRVLSVGFSLGAQLAFKLVAEHEELFLGAVVVSPWLIKEEPFLSKVLSANLKQQKQFKSRFMCGLVATLNGLSGEQRGEFVEQMQLVSEETVRNSVDNGITLDSVPRFAEVTLPVVALCGGKEQDEVKNSVKAMAKNPYCRFEIWEKAAHNIPPMYAKRFNELICEVYGECAEKAP